jgi:hypothetical protein
LRRFDAGGGGEPSLPHHSQDLVTLSGVQLLMFIGRGAGAAPQLQGLAVKLTPATPPTVKNAAGKTDFFCVGEAEAIAALREAGWQAIELRDGYYEDGRGDGVAIWGYGKYWEIRSEPLTVVEACGASDQAQVAGDSEHVEVRRAIFGA